MQLRQPLLHLRLLHLSKPRALTQAFKPAI
jgi:hypothetical protein